MQIMAHFKTMQFFWIKNRKKITMAFSKLAAACAYFLAS